MARASNCGGFSHIWTWSLSDTSTRRLGKRRTLAPGFLLLHLGLRRHPVLWTLSSVFAAISRISRVTPLVRPVCPIRTSKDHPSICTSGLSILCIACCDSRDAYFSAGILLLRDIIYISRNYIRDAAVNHGDVSCPFSTGGRDHGRGNEAPRPIIIPRLSVVLVIRIDAARLAVRSSSSALILCIYAPASFVAPMSIIARNCAWDPGQ
ncbi:hypothetical protein NEOLEDRAFT_30034 [Neolentinus lepideus HHB14362 ss-1]|uniref:Uncharacterized protein n=1 Tax=Neolentinus lepideus HHB14362 ss-1 TaxID=1314782 RepID=A0A165W5W0_9AGAM|nr:hypothetical protein NEOLEDRAFT_30034 [Neolentinus lepideus HHB14362 ss-1]